MRNYSFAEKQVLIDSAWNDVMKHRKYFGTVGGGASLIQRGEVRIFENGVGQVEQNLSTGADVTLTDAESSLMGKGGTIPNGESFVIVGIGIQIELSGVQATTPFEDDSVTSIDVTPLSRSNPIPLLQTLKAQTTFELWRNSRELLEQGGIEEYPSEFGNTGFAGGGDAAGTGTADQNVYIQTNGMKTRALTVYQVLDSLDQFYGVLKFNREIDLASTLLTGHIDVYLVGRAMTNREATEYVAQFGG